MTKVLVDLLFMTGGKGGMESYVRSLYEGLASVECEFNFVALLSSEASRSDMSWFPGDVVTSRISGESRWRWALGELLSVSAFATSIRADLIHCPANVGPIRTRVPVVLTVHDVLPLRHPEWVPHGRSRVLGWLIKSAARMASRIITVSEASAVDITRLTAVPRGRIDVTPLAGFSSTGHLASAQPRDDGQLIAVGNRMPHKNFDRLVRSIALIPTGRRPHLTITGSGPADPLIALVSKLGLEPWVTLEGWLSSDELRYRYETATLCVIPTLFEGFGMPVLEAMSSGCPVLCSDLPVLHEVAGDAAHYANPLDESAMANAIDVLLSNPRELASMSARGLNRAAGYNWTSTAELTLATFRRALAER